MKRTDKRLWWLLMLGLEVIRELRDELYCCCPFCGREKDHFGFNVSKMVYNCFSCGSSGGYEDLMGKLAINLSKDITRRQLATLAKYRRLPVQAFERYQIGYTGRFYTLPVKDADGKIVNVQRYALGRKLLNAPSCRAGLFGSEHLADEAREGEPVYLVEGFWDLASFEWLRRKVRKPGILVATLGAGMLPDGYVERFRDRHVRVCMDNDNAGAKGESCIYQKLRPVVAGIEFFQWCADEPRGWDLSDLICEVVA